MIIIIDVYYILLAKKTWYEQQSTNLVMLYLNIKT